MTAVRVVIPSRRRIGNVKALQLFPKATLCVCEDEAADYAAAYPENDLLVHPVGLGGIGPLRQWILDNVPDLGVLQVNDDVHKLTAIGSGFRRGHSADDAEILVASTAQCALDIGASVFGFSQTSGDVRKFQPDAPFGVSGWAGGVVGFLGRKHRYDQKLLLRADIDFFLQCLRRDRIVWIETRYSFEEVRFKGAGGNAKNRSQERHQHEMNYLKKKWGPWVEIRPVKTTTRIIVKVQR